MKMSPSLNALLMCVGIDEAQRTLFHLHTEAFNCIFFPTLQPKVRVEDLCVARCKLLPVKGEAV